MDFPGLTIEDRGQNNHIEIDESASFKRSRIIIEGDNNQIILGKSLSYTNLVVNFKGNNKYFEVKDSTKNINGLKFVSIRADNQVFKIGNNFSCGGLEVQMNDGDETCTIGDDGLFSWGIKIRTSDGHSVVDLATDEAINIPKNVHIGDRVWVGEDVRFLKGAEIPQDCVVGSCAVVTKKFNQTNCVIAGFPASIVKEILSGIEKNPVNTIKKSLESTERTKIKKIILHIGSGKTGSTSIQRALFECKPHNEYCYTYPTLLKYKNSQVFRFAFCDSSKTTSDIRGKYYGKDAEYFKFQEAIKNSFIKQIEAHDTVIVSSEFLFSSSQKEVLKIKSFLDGLGFTEIHIVMYLRDPAKYYLSVAQQALKTQHKTPTPDNFQYDLIGAVDNWSAIEPTSITVKEFDRDMLIGGDVVEDFGHYINHVLGTDITLSLSQTQNESMSVEGAVILQEFHKLLSRCNFDFETRTPYVQRARKFSRVATLGSKPVLKPEIVQYIYQRYQSDILKLYERFNIFSSLLNKDFVTTSTQPRVVDFLDIVTQFDIDSYLDLKNVL